MMKIFLRVSFVVLLSSFFAIQIHASSYTIEEEVRLFPKQPHLIYDSSLGVMNPFKMPSFNFGVELPVKYYDGSLILSIMQLLQKKEYGTEIPCHKDRVALGFSVSSTETQIEDFPLTNLAGCIKLKLRAPLYSQIGSISIGLIPKLGVVTSKTKIPYSIQNAAGIGITGGMGMGIDYFFNQWIGCYCEYSIAWNYIPFGSLPAFSREHCPGYYTAGGVQYPLKTFIIGFRTTLI